MNFEKIIPLIFIITLYYTGSFAENNKNCSEIESDTAVKIYEKWKCNKDNPDGQSFGKKLKNLFKKKN